MAREIKFRAWDKVRIVMSPIAYLNFGDEGFALTTTLKTAPIDMYDDERVVGESAVLMQFTGLYDKNGVEIYEGDILSGNERYKGSPSVVRWNEEGAYFHVYRGDTSSGYTLEGEVKWSEVIGNVWENPTLLALNNHSS